MLQFVLKVDSNSKPGAEHDDPPHEYMPRYYKRVDLPSVPSVGAMFTFSGSYDAPDKDADAVEDHLTLNLFSIEYLVGPSHTTVLLNLRLLCYDDENEDRYEWIRWEHGAILKACGFGIGGIPAFDEGSIAVSLSVPGRVIRLAASERKPTLQELGNLVGGAVAKYDPRNAYIILASAIDMAWSTTSGDDPFCDAERELSEAACALVSRYQDFAHYAPG